MVFIEEASTLATIPATGDAHALDSQWESSNAWVRSYGKLHEIMRYRLGATESVAGIPVVIVTGEAELDFEPDPKKTGANGPQLNVQMTEGRATTQIMFDLQRHEVVGRNNMETVRIETSAKSPQLTFTSIMEQTIQSQAIRIAEDQEP